MQHALYAVARDLLVACVVVWALQERRDRSRHLSTSAQATGRHPRYNGLSRVAGVFFNWHARRGC